MRLDMKSGYRLKTFSHVGFFDLEKTLCPNNTRLNGKRQIVRTS